MKRLTTLAACISISIAQSFGSRPSVFPRSTITRAETRPKRHISVADSIAMTITMQDDYRFPFAVYGSGPLAIFSPDENKLIVVLKKGNVEQDTNEYSILLFQTSEVFRAPAADVLLVMSSSSNREAIKDPLWLDDNETIAFLGELPGELRQLYTFNIRQRTLTRRTKETGNILSYTITPKGDQFAYVVEEPVQSVFEPKTRREGLIVSRQSAYELVRATKGGPYGSAQLWFQTKGNVRKRLNISDRISEWSTHRPYLSPDGRHIVIALQAADVPQSWRNYSDPRMQEATEVKLAPSGYFRYSFLRRYVLVDTRTGESQILLNSPLNLGDAPQVVWLPDSRSVLLGDVYLPLDIPDQEYRKTRLSKTFSVEVRLPGRELIEITDEKLKLLRWDARRNSAVYETSGDNEGFTPTGKVLFRRYGNKWARLSNIAGRVGRPEIVQEEDLNTPPRLYAVDDTHGKALLLDLNPELKELRIGKVEEIRWKATNGHEVKGGLYYPVDYVPGKKYPLVIQTHGWQSNRFLLDGPFPTGFAAQPLAGKNIMVLQTDEGVQPGYINTPQEAPGEVAGFEGAITYLDSRGLIDRNRVGIFGFSRTCFHIKYALSHPKYHFAAASIGSGFDGSYTSDLLFSHLPGSDYEKVNNGVPFGDNLKLWFERSPAFGIDRVQTPLRIVAESPQAALFEYFWFSASTLLGKPVEMVILEAGEHFLRKPSERQIASQGNVDWFCFWLKDEEDPDPSKAEQYARWRELRKLQEQNEKNFPAPSPN